MIVLCVCMTEQFFCQLLTFFPAIDLDYFYFLCSSVHMQVVCERMFVRSVEDKLQTKYTTCLGTPDQ